MGRERLWLSWQTKCEFQEVETLLPSWTSLLKSHFKAYQRKLGNKTMILLNGLFPKSSLVLLSSYFVTKTILMMYVIQPVRIFNFM